MSLVNCHFVGLDLGQAQDFTAIAVLCRTRVTGRDIGEDKKPPYAVPYLRQGYYM